MNSDIFVFRVYYYEGGFKPSTINAGTYLNFNDALTRLNYLVPNSVPHVNNTVFSPTNKNIGWIKKYKIGDAHIDVGSMDNNFMGDWEH